MGNKWALISFSDAVLVNPAVRLKKGTEYPFVDMKSINPSWREASYSEIRTFKSGGAKFLPRDTLMARITPCLENGKIARYIPDGNTSPAFGSTEFIVIRGKQDVTDNDFAYYLTQWPDFREFAISQMTGTSGRQRVPAESLANFTFRLPSPPEQRAIAHILGSLDDKIELNLRMNGTLETMALAMFTSWFVDFDPVIDNALAAGNSIPEELNEKAAIRKAIDNNCNTLPKEVRNLFPNEFEHTEEMGWVPKGWGIQALYDTANYINGAAYKNFHFTDELDALPVVKIAEIKNGISSQTKFTKTELADKYRIYDGDILFSWSGNPDTSIDTFVWTGGPGWLNQHIFKVALKNDNDRNFVYYQLKVLRPEFAEIARNKQTTGLGHVTAQDMKRLYVIKPSSSILTAFNTNAGMLFNKWYANALSIRSHSKLRDTLLPKLLSGEICIPEAENIVGSHV